MSIRNMRLAYCTVRPSMGFGCKYSFFVLWAAWLLIGLSAHGQEQRTIEQQIHWQTKPGGFTFEQAVFPETENGVPYFAGVLRTEDFFAEAGMVQLELIDAKFEPFSPGPLAASLAQVHGPALIQRAGWARGRAHTEWLFFPFRLQQGGWERCTAFSLKVSRTEYAPKKDEPVVGTLSPLAQGRWHRMAVSASGMRKISYESLRALGYERPELVRVFGFGGSLPLMNADARPWLLPECRVLHTGNALLFYAQGPHTWQWNARAGMYLRQKNYASDQSYYFITDRTDTGFDNRVPTQTPPATPNAETNAYDAVRVHERDQINLLKSGREWYGETFESTPQQTFRFDWPPLVPNAPCKQQWVFLAQSKPASSFDLTNTAWTGQLTIAELSYQYEREIARADTLRGQFSWPGDATMEYQVAFRAGSPSAKAWLDHAQLNARAQLRYQGQAFEFWDGQAVAPARVLRYRMQTDSDVLVWEVTQPQLPVQQATQWIGQELNFVAAAETERRFVAFRPEDVPAETAAFVPVANQNLLGLPMADLLIIVHPDLVSAANDLADFHRQVDGLRVQVADQQQIFNELSSGAPDVAALRDFVRLFYLRARQSGQVAPKYLLLLGDGSYDPKNILGRNSSTVLCYQSANSLYNTRSYVSDDFFGLLDQDEGESIGFLDIGIGRLPARHLADAQAMVAKIKSYYQQQTTADWANNLAFVADDGEDGDGWYFMAQTEALARKALAARPEVQISKIYLDAYEQVSTAVGAEYPEVNAAIDRAVENGTLLINYVGHGGEEGWADEHILRIEDQIMRWNNPTRLTTLMTATCEFSRFDDPRAASAGEWCLYNASGGAVALFTTTRLVYAFPNAVLNNRFFDFVLNPLNTEDQSVQRLGDIMRRTKVAVGSDTNKLNFTLLGDPAMPLAFPSQQVVLRRINGQPLSQQADTLRALQKVRFEAELVDSQGQLVQGAQGRALPRVIDRPTKAFTRGNDYPAFEYEQFDRFLYQGQSSVADGRLQFEFVVPKDIRYQYGFGRVSVYANYAQSNASGAYTQILIGGTDTVRPTDVQGPQIRLFFNDEQFVPGGTTHPQPTLKAKLFDESGINTLGTGIGHDIEIWIDGNQRKRTSLNAYYRADLDSYQSGTLEYKLPTLDPGPHTLHLKAWDVLNNSAEAEIDFVVQSDERLSIERLFNYPNPFTQRTAFFFYHNHPNEELDVLIHIYAPSGKLVKSIEQNLISPGYLSPAIEWDGLDDFGQRLGRGVYFYRIGVRSASGKSAEKYERLLLLK